MLIFKWTDKLMKSFYTNTLTIEDLKRESLEKNMSEGFWFVIFKMREQYHCEDNQQYDDYVQGVVDIVNSLKNKYDTISAASIAKPPLSIGKPRNGLKRGAEIRFEVYNKDFNDEEVIDKNLEIIKSILPLVKARECQAYYWIPAVKSGKRWLKAAGILDKFNIRKEILVHA